MAKPKNTDWNNDGTADIQDTWIELYNANSVAVDLSGWQLGAIDGSTSYTFTLPLETRIDARGFLLFFSKETHLQLGRSGELQLMYPSGAVADAVRYPEMRDDQPLARTIDGAGQWVDDCVASPNARNCQARVTLTSSFNEPYFRKNIAGLSIVNGIDPNVILTNSILALILALAMGFFGTLLNDSLETHEEHVLGILAPIRRLLGLVRAAGGRVDALLAKSRLLSWLSFPLRLAVLLLISGLVLAFLDPSFNPRDRDGLLLIVALALSAGLVGLSDDIAQYIYLKRTGHRSVVRLHGGNLILVLATTLFSRFSQLAPGLLVGSPAGIEEVDDPNFEIKSHVLGIGAMAFVGIVAAVLVQLVIADAWFETLFLLVFAAAVQTLFFEMLPLKYLHGRGMFQFNRALWLVAFAVVAFVFMQTMLNPTGAFAAAFDSPNMVMLAVVVIAFCAFSTLTWFYLQNLEKSEVTREVSPGS